MEPWGLSFVISFVSFYFYVLVFCYLFQGLQFVWVAVCALLFVTANTVCFCLGERERMVDAVHNIGGGVIVGRYMGNTYRLFTYLITTVIAHAKTRTNVYLVLAVHLYIFLRNSSLCLCACVGVDVYI